MKMRDKIARKSAVDNINSWYSYYVIILKTYSIDYLKHHR